MRSRLIDDRGFLTQTYEVVDGCEDELFLMRPGWLRWFPFSVFRRHRYSKLLADIMLVRQVPGDGSCLFHSLTVTLAYASNGTHHSMNNIKSMKDNSNKLRQTAIDAFEEDPEKLLYLQGSECTTCRELLEAVAEQYSITPEVYCTKMRRSAEWGGGPEIVVLSNILHRPIHIYELSTIEGEETEEIKQEAPENKVTRQAKMRKRWCLRRIACFGSPKFDRSEALHILSADSRFPDLEPGDQLPNGDHFLALFPSNAGV